VQHEGDPLCRREPIEDDQHGAADRIGEQSILVCPSLGDPLELVGVGDRLLCSPFARQQLVDCLAGGDRGEPTRQVLDRVVVCPTGLQPGGLHSVFGVSHRAEQVKRHRLQVAPIPVKPLHEIFDGLHGHLSQAKSVKETTTSDERSLQRRPMQ
jgi:hypothetical protein